AANVARRLAAAARNEIVHLVGEERLIEADAGNAVVCPADLAMIDELVELDDDGFADREAGPAEVADAETLGRELDHQALDRGLARPANPHRLPHGVSFVCADRQHRHRETLPSGHPE